MTPEPLVLVGAGGFARETLELIHAINAVTPTWTVVGLLDDDERLHGGVVGGVRVIGPCEDVHAHPDARVTLCVASPTRPASRLDLSRRLGLKPERYATLIHPAAVVARSATIGAGSVVHAGTVLTADVTLGTNVAVMPAVVLTHDDRVEDGVTFGAGARVAGGVHIREGAYIGSGALIREHVEIGRCAVVGMGAVVTKAIPAGETWVGIPAARLRVGREVLA